MITAPLRQKKTNKKGQMPMGNVSYSAHISNGKSAITSKKALAGVAKHNLRKYKSADYSSENIRLIYGTTDLFQDVKRVYHREFDDAVKEYNSRQKREDRKIKDYFEHVAGLNQDMAVEIIFQCGDKKYWDEHWKNKNYMSEVFDYILECLQKLLPEFKIANAVIHFDEASPHMHVVGVPVWEGTKRGLSKKVSKRNVFTPQAKKLYYDTFIDKNSYTRGLPQGLPQSYFFGNVCMTRIAQIVNDNFEGKAVYYVDDSYVYTNYKLEDKIGEINKKIKDIASGYINRISDSDAFVRQANFPNVLDNKETYLIHIYDEGKSTCTEIKHCKEGEIYLRMLSREASQISNDIKSSYSDEEDLTMLNKAETLLNSIECEMGLDNLDSGYKEKLERYYKFFKYRTIRLRLKTERGLSKTLFDVFDNTLKNDSKNNTDDRYRKLSEGDVDIKKFFESYKSDIWAVAIELIITNTISKQELNYVSEYISNVISAIYEKDLMACSYMKKVYESYMNSDEIHSTTDPYSTLNQIINRKMMRFTNLNSEVLSQEFEGIKLKGIKENILSSFDICSEEFIDACYIVNNSTNRLKRMFLNAVYSKVFKVSISDDIVIGSYDKKGITYGALRILVYLRNQLCDIDEFFIWNMELKSRDNLQKVDYALFEVLGAYKKYVINAQYIDNLIMIHKYTCDVWKNGAKHLYFYTLHNQEHAIDLVKNIIKIIKVISYFKISYYDYYILFITCYLHDIAMVRIAADDEFLLDEYKSNEIATEYAHKWKDADDNDIKKLILDIYKELDQFFEDRIRSNHAKNSAAEIRTRHELDFLEPSVRENIAKIAENHIADVKNVYFVKGDAQNSLISYKFDMILLRIADLLDMSERRISKPILNHNIDNMSKESAFHWISHLLTENYTLVSKYENGYAKDTDSYLAPGNMIERVELTIFVDMSQFSKIQTGGCRYCKIDENTISPYGFDIYMLNGESEVCDGKKCNFLCKWFNKKMIILFRRCRR